MGAGAIYASYAVPYVGAISGTIMGGVAEYQLGMFMINIAKENPVLYASLIGPVLPGVTLETVETAPTIGFDKASGTLSFKDTAMPEPAHVELAIGGMNNGPDSQILFGKKKTDMWDGSPIQLDMATIAKYPLNDQGKWEIAYKNDNPKLTTQDRNHPICVDVPSNAIINGEGKWEITVNTQTKPEKIIVDVPTQLVFEGDNRSMNIPFGRELFVKMSGQVNGSGPLNGLQSDMNIPGTYQYDVYNTASDPAPLFQITAIVK